MKRQRPTSTSASDALHALSLFADCTDGDLDRLLPYTDRVTFPAATVIDRKGTRPSQVVGIVDGYVRGFDANGRPFVLGPGDHIGAAELLTDRPHTATYTTSTTATLVAVFGPAFRSGARSLPGVAARATTPRRTYHVRSAGSPAFV